MSRLITTGNLAIFEYPKPHHAIPKFTLEKDGVLWIEGYNVPFTPDGNTIRAMKRFETGLKNYIVVGRYSYAKDNVKGDFDNIMESENVDKDNCVIMVKESKETE